MIVKQVVAKANQIAWALKTSMSLILLLYLLLCALRLGLVLILCYFGLSDSNFVAVPPVMCFKTGISFDTFLFFPQRP